MFKQKVMFEIADAEVIDLCRILGKYGVKFKIGKVNHVTMDETDPFGTKHYRMIAVYASNRQVRKICDELSDESDF